MPPFSPAARTHTRDGRCPTVCLVSLAGWQITLVQEGSVVRAITRLDELCREVREKLPSCGDRFS